MSSSHDSAAHLWNKALDLIPGGNMLLSKNRNLFSPGRWPTYYTKAKGPHVWDLDNTKYLDFSTNGVGACSLGHANELVDEHVIAAIKNGVMSTLNSPAEVSLAQTLISLHPWAEMARFARSGGEANAVAIRIARAASGRDKVAICGYHGWHDWYLAANLSDNSNLDAHLLEGLSPVGVPQSLTGTIVPFRFNNFDDLKLLDNPELAAVKMEVVRSEPPLPNYLETIRSICTKNNTILIFDECTSGFREAFGGIHLNYDVMPDMCMLGKALGNGFAISAVLGRRAIMEYASKSFISSTFWTEAVGPVAALATLQQMRVQQSWEILPALGKDVKKIWKKYASQYSIPLQITGIDALPTFQFKTPNPLACKTYFTELMLTKGFLSSNLFYPTTSHRPSHLALYEEAIADVFSTISRCLSDNLDFDTLCAGGPCRPTFQRLN